MTRELNKYDVVEVTFNTSNQAFKERVYAYKMHASMKPAAGDTVVVQSPYQGLVTCTVQKVLSKNTYGAERATKWVVDKVDCRFYHTLMASEAELAAAREADLRQQHKINTVQQLIATLPVNSKASKLLRQAIQSL